MKSLKEFRMKITAINVIPPASPSSKRGKVKKNDAVGFQSSNKNLKLN